MIIHKKRDGEEDEGEKKTEPRGGVLLSGRPRRNMKPRYCNRKTASRRPDDTLRGLRIAGRARMVRKYIKQRSMALQTMLNAKKDRVDSRWAALDVHNGNRGALNSPQPISSYISEIAHRQQFLIHRRSKLERLEMAGGAPEAKRFASSFFIQKVSHSPHQPKPRHSRR